MQKGENIVAIALAGVVLLAVVAVQRRWNPASIKEAATSAEDFILTTAGIRGQAPNIAGYERLKSIRLGDYTAGLYRATPAPLIFAPGRLVVYDHSNLPVYKLETLEGSKEPWSTLYDFNGRRGIPVRGGRPRPAYTRDLTGDGTPDVIVGQYTGGDHCCTVVTILELGKDSATAIGRIAGLDGLPFEGLEIRRINKGASTQLIAHRPYATICGTHYDAADVLAVYALSAGRFEDESVNFGGFFQDVLRADLAKWKKEKNRNLALLQTLAVDYAALGQKDAGKRFFALNLGQLLPVLKNRNVDPNACIDAVEGMLDRVPVVHP